MPLTPEELTKWCKSKKDYKPLIRKKDRTAEEEKDMRRMAVEYHEWQHYNSIKSKQLKYNPKVHTGPLFDEFKGGS